MDIDTQRKLDRVLGSALCRLLSLFHWRRGDGGPAQVDKVLVILLSEMGSLVLAYPMFQRIKKLYPRAAVHVLLFQKNREVLDVLNVVPPQQVFTIDGSSFRHLVRDSLSVLARLRRDKFDVVIDCELFSRISSLFSYLSGARIRVGFHRHCQEGLYRGDFINRPVLYNPYQHISQQFITMVEAIESPTVPKAKRLATVEPPETPALHFGAEEIRATRQRLHAYAPEVVGKRLVLLNPGGGLLPIRAWPLESYCRLAQQLLQEGCAVGVIGMGQDKELARKIQACCGSSCCVDLTGYTKTVRELMLLFHCADLLITNDGGPGQFSVMTPLPTIVFFGPETPTLYGRLDGNAYTFYSSLSCSPCITAYNHRKSPCDGDNVCLKRIDPEQVFAKAREMLARSAPLHVSEETPYGVTTNVPKPAEVVSVGERRKRAQESPVPEKPSYPS